MEEAVRQILKFIGENPEREGLVDTPKRVTESFQYLMQGYKQNPEEIIKKSDFQRRMQSHGDSA